MGASEIKPRYHIRIHGTDYTQDLVVDMVRQAAVARANSFIQTGVWVENRLYPPSSIVYIELIEVK